MHKRKNIGMGLVEIIIGASIISVGILAAITSFTTYVQYSLANQKNVQAGYLLEEGLEVMTFFRDKGWAVNVASLSTSTPYYLTWNGSGWDTSTIPTYVDGLFLRSISVGDVMRDVNDRISNSGTYDPNTKQITATVSFWQGHGTTTKSISTYIANIN